MWIWDDDGSRSCGDSAIFISLSKSGEERPTNKRTRDLRGAWDWWRHWQPTHCRPISGSSGWFLTSNYLSILSQSAVNNADFQQTADYPAHWSTETEVDVPKKRKSTLLRVWVSLGCRSQSWQLANNGKLSKRCGLHEVTETHVASVSSQTSCYTTWRVH